MYSLFLAFILLPMFHSPASFAEMVSLAWTPPTENMDGTPLTDLAGYKIYAGAASGVYVSAVDLGNVTTHALDLSPGTHYLAVTAYNVSGDESTYSNEISITIDSSAPMPDIAVTDSAAPADDLLVPFGNVTEFLTSEHTVTVANAGNADLAIQDVALADLLSGPFSIVADGCSGQSISSGSSCSLIVSFSPTGAGSFQDSFDISSNDPDEGVVTVGVSGTGLSSSVQLPDVTVTDSVAPADDLLVPFGNITELLTSKQTVTVGNAGSAVLAIQGVALADSLSGPFGIVADGCSGQSISPGSSCSVIVDFSPLGAGSFQDSFDISTNDPDEGVVTVGVSGTGLSSVNNDPSVPVLVSPAQGAQGLEHTVTFLWKKSVDPDGDTVTYYLYVDEDPGFSSSMPLFVASLNRDDTPSGRRGGYTAGVLLAGMAVAGGLAGRRRIVALMAAIALMGVMIISCDPGGTGVPGGAPLPADDQIARAVSGLNAQTTYYWKVVADDGKGGSAESEVRSFTTK